MCGAMCLFIPLSVAYESQKNFVFSTEVQNCSRSVAYRPRSREPYSLVYVFYAIQGEEV